MSNTKHLKQLGQKKTKYLTRPSIKILETFENKHLKNLYLVPFTQTRDEFTSLCPRTGQPDFAKFEIIYIPNSKMVESKSLKLYLFSFRNHGEFHEDVTNRIFNDLWQLLEPKYLRVFGDFAARGGIAIKPLVARYGDQVDFEQSQIIDRLVENWDRQK